MLQHFLAAEVDGKPTKGLFKNLKITKVDNGAYLKHQGRYPVIFVTFKDIKNSEFKDGYSNIVELFVRLYGKYNYLVTSNKLICSQKKLHQIILNREANKAQLQNSLLTLSESLYQHHGVKPWLLIDEYDTPIQAAFQYGYYEEMIGFMRNLFGAALKTNPYVERAVITGILRIFKPISR